MRTGPQASLDTKLSLRWLVQHKYIRNEFTGAFTKFVLPARNAEVQDSSGNYYLIDNNGTVRRKPITKEA